MYKICIADDEKYVLKSITHRIENSGMELEVVGTARNGLEALELYEKIRPDIYFVDINMPVVSGLELIDKIRQRDLDTDTRFIIISGYDDFAYMKRAIQLGVVNYVKKPIVQQEFTEMLLDVFKQLEESEKRGKKEDRQSISWTDFLQSRQSKQLEGTFLLIRKKSIGIRSKQFAETIDRHNRQRKCTVVYFYGVQDVLMLFFEGVCLNSRELDEFGRSDGLSQVTQLIYYTGICSDLEKMAGRFEDVLNIRFYHPEYRMIKLRETTGERIDIYYEAFDAALDNIDEDHYTECLVRLWKPILAEEKYYCMIQQIYHSLILIIANKYTKYDLIIPSKLKQELFHFALSAFDDRREMMECLKKYSADLNALIGEVTSKSELVDNVIWYIKQHFREDISLCNLAEHFFVVPAYLSRKFKEKKNCTVMQYLENVRLCKARELLEFTSMPISDIALAVGYNDSNYFARSFRKIYGVSPREYRSIDENALLKTEI